MSGLAFVSTQPATATTAHNLTADCTSGNTSESLNPGINDTITIASSSCTTIFGSGTNGAGTIWTSPGISGVDGESVTFPITLTIVGTGAWEIAFSPSPLWQVRGTVLPPPSAPSGIAATVENQQTTVSWSSASGSPDYYEVEQSLDNSTWSQPFGSCSTQINAQTLTCEATGLVNGTPYYFRVRAGNGSGASPWDPLATPVTPSLPPPAPTSIVGIAGDAQVSLSWTAPVMDNTYAAITGYKIEFNDGSTWSTSVANTGSTATSATVQSLSNGTEYTFRVSAINGAGAGTASADSAGVTPFGVPDPVDLMIPPFSVTQLDDSTLQISWDEPASNGKPILGYEVEYATVSGSPPSQGSYGPPPAGSTCASGSLLSRTCTITGLTSGDYSLQIRAENAAGWGQWGQTGMPITLLGPASAPTSFNDTAGNAQVELSWGLPTSWGGQTPFMGFTYEIEQSTDGGSTWTSSGMVTIPGLSQQQPNFPATSSLTITGLTNGTAYDFRVSAVTSYGTGAWATVTSATPSTIPGDPASVTATPGDTQVSLAWTAPASNGGSAITDYQYQISTTSGGVWDQPVTIGSAATSVTVSGLTNGTTYVFRVRAKNVNGWSTPGTVSNSVTPVTLPGTPSGLSATHGNDQVSLSWTPGASVGTTLTGHLIEMSTNSGGAWTTAIATTGSALGSATVTGLSNGTAYLFRVAGISSAGAGLPVTLGNAVTPSTTSGAITGLTAQLGDQQVALSWTAPAVTGGAAITGYKVEKYDAVNGWKTVTADTASTATTYTVTGLTNGTSYDFRVTPLNVNGASVVTPPTLANAVTPVAAPGVPAQPTAVAGPGSATITVTAGTGGTPASFAVTALDPNSQTAGACTVTGASGSCTISGLTAGTAYTFTATATNANSTSSASIPSVAVTPTAPTTPTNPPAPTPPVGGGSGGSSGGGSSPGVTDGTTAPGNIDSPLPEPPGVNISATPGPQGAGATVGGSVVPVRVQPVSPPANGMVPNGTNVQVGAASVQLNGPTMGGSKAPSTLTVIPGQAVNLSASGFVPGSSVGLYAIPSGVRVGSIPVDGDGSVSGSAVVDLSAALGMTAVQMAGQTATGIANISISVATGPPAVPARTNAGALPEVSVGSSVVLVDGVPQVNTPRRTGSTINVVERGSALTLAAEDASGQTRPLRSNGEMTIQEEGLVALQGSGYSDYVDVFIFSEPVFVGRILVDQDGTFKGNLPVPVDLENGQHTLQSVGQGASGESVAISVSVRKFSEEGASGEATVARKAVAFHKNSARLDAKDRKRIRALMNSASDETVSITLMGTYLKGKKTKRDVKMAKQRAVAVRTYLKSLGVDGSITVGVRARKKSVSPTTPNRYVVVTVRSG